MNRRSFFGLMAVAPVAIAAAPPALAFSRKAFDRAFPRPKIKPTIQVRKPMRFRELSDAEMEERYFRPAAEAMNNKMLQDMAAGKFNHLFYSPGATS